MRRPGLSRVPSNEKCSSLQAAEQLNFTPPIRLSKKRAITAQKLLGWHWWPAFCGKERRRWI